jgi:hypothetical protein
MAASHRHYRRLCAYGGYGYYLTRSFGPSLDDCHVVPNGQWRWGMRSSSRMWSSFRRVQAPQDQQNAITSSRLTHPGRLGRGVKERRPWLHRLQPMTMGEGAGPRDEERHCADADGDHRFSYDEEPQRRQNYDEAAYDDNCLSSRETIGC